MQETFRDTGSIPGSGRSPGEDNGNPLQYSCWRIPWTEEPGRLQSMESQSRSQLKQLSRHTLEGVKWGPHEALIPFPGASPDGPLWTLQVTQQVTEMQCQRSLSLFFTPQEPDPENLSSFSESHRLRLRFRPRADCGLDHEPLIAKFRLKLKKVVGTEGFKKLRWWRTCHDYQWHSLDAKMLIGVNWWGWVEKLKGEVIKFT